MTIIRTLLLFFVAILSANAREVAANPEVSGAPKSTGFPGDGEITGSPNAHLRRSFSVAELMARISQLEKELAAAKKNTSQLEKELAAAKKNAVDVPLESDLAKSCTSNNCGCNAGYCNCRYWTDGCGGSPADQCTSGEAMCVGD